MNLQLNYFSPEDAWLSSFTKTIDLLVDNTPITQEVFKEKLKNDEYRDLILDINVGRDTEYGIWSMLGARMAIYMTLLTDWDISLVNDNESIAEIWVSIEDQDPEIVAARVAEGLVEQLDLTIVNLYEDESKFFKSYLQNYQP